MALFEVISKTRDKNPDSEVLVPGWVKPGKKDQQPPEPEATPQEAGPQEPAAPTPPTPPAAPTPPPEPEPETVVQEDPAPKTAVPEPSAPEPKTADDEPAAKKAAPPKTMFSEAPTQVPDTPEVEEPVKPPKPVGLSAYTDSQEPAPPVVETSTWEAGATDGTPEEISDQPPIWSTDGSRLTLSLNYVSCLVASIGLLLVLIASFVLGRMTASPATTASNAAGAVAVRRETGKFYMVVQILPGRGEAAMAEAKRIAKFCIENKEPAEVKLLNNNLIVWSATPFDAKSGEKVIKHALKLHNELGPKYAAKYGSSYRFAQPQRNGQLVPLMYPYTKPKKR